VEDNLSFTKVGAVAGSIGDLKALLRRIQRPLCGSD
jgi:hypothetical protein